MPPLSKHPPPAFPEEVLAEGWLQLYCNYRENQNLIPQFRPLLMHNSHRQCVGTLWCDSCASGVFSKTLLKVRDMQHSVLFSRSTTLSEWMTVALPYWHMRPNSYWTREVWHRWEIHHHGSHPRHNQCMVYVAYCTVCVFTPQEVFHGLVKWLGDLIVTINFFLPFFTRIDSSCFFYFVIHCSQFGLSLLQVLLKHGYFHGNYKFRPQSDARMKPIIKVLVQYGSQERSKASKKLQLRHQVSNSRVKWANIVGKPSILQLNFAHNKTWAQTVVRNETFCEPSQ